MTARKAMTRAVLLGLVGVCWSAIAEAKTQHRTVAPTQVHERHHVIERHRGRRVAVPAPSRLQKGQASVYAMGLRGRKMADGTPFNPASNAAASKTLPLGTMARVTNLANGRSTTVKVRDRGPHKAGRILDVSPGSAGALGMGRDGLAPVAIAPLASPPVR